MTWPFKSKSKQPHRQASIIFTITLMHDFGHEISIPDVSSEDTKFIQDNLGKDCIFTVSSQPPYHTFNLSKFSYAKCEPHSAQPRQEP